MFGKGGGPLNAWIKEFCELVFIQTLQAFIFAIVISFVVNLSATNVVEDGDRNVAYGIICIVALTSIFKIEEIVRRIFGYGPTKADHGNAVQSIGKSMMALHMGKNLLDNGRKVIGGAAKVRSAEKDYRSYINKNTKRQEAWRKDNGLLDDENDTTTKTKTKTSLPAGADAKAPVTAINKPQESQNAAKKAELLEKARAERERARKLTEQASKIDQYNKNDSKTANKKQKYVTEAINANLLAEGYENEANQIDVSTVSVSGNASADTSASGSSKKSAALPKDYYQKNLQWEEELDAKKKEMKKQKREGYKQMASGALESGAAMIGFGVGTAMGVASTNDWGSSVKDGITWAGTADAFTAGTVDVAFGAGEFLADRASDVAKATEEYAENFKSEYNKAVKQAEREVQDGVEAQNRQAQAAVDEINASASRASRSSTYKSTGGSKTKPRVSKVGVAYNAAKNTFASTKTLEKNYRNIINEYKSEEKKANIGKVSDIDKNVLN